MESHGYRDGDVHADHSHFNLAREVACGFTAASENCRAVGELVRIDETHGGRAVRNSHNAQYGPEYFLLIDAHLGANVVKQSRAQEITSLVTGDFLVTPVEHQARAFLYTEIDVAAHPLEVCLSHQRPHLDSSRVGWPDFQVPGACTQPLDQVVCCRIADGDGHGDRHAAFSG